MTAATTSATEVGRLRVTVDGMSVEVAEGASVLEAVEAAGVRVSSSKRWQK